MRPQGGLFLQEVEPRLNEEAKVESIQGKEREHVSAQRKGQEVGAIKNRQGPHPWRPRVLKVLGLYFLQ